jgi:hypothetical protein
VSYLDGFSLLEDYGASSSWLKKLYIATALALNCSARRRSGRGQSPPNNWRSCPGLNDDPSLCATLLTDGGVGEL